MKIKHLISATLLFSTIICGSFINSVSAERKQNESAQYSDYLCVNIANSPKTSLAILQSVLPSNSKSNSHKISDKLPSVRGINLKVEYVNSETTEDIKLTNALKKASNYKPSNIGSSPRYYYNKVDLNDDGKLEVIVYPVGMGFCGSGGCQTYIFQTKKDDYIPIAMLPVTNQPIIATEQKTSGWRDLVVHRSGGGATATYHLIKFNGRAYLDSRTEVASNSTITGTAFIADNLVHSKGIPF